MNAVLTTEGLSKDYGPVRVVSDISLEFHAGSIHALLGENGAGKSTLIGMLAGAKHPSEGTILLDGQRVRFRSVKEAQAAGIVALPQELVLVGSLGAAENIFLGMRRPGLRGTVDRRLLNRDARSQLARLGVELDVTAPVRELSAVQQTMVALARALAREARVLVLDEPTAALSASESDHLFSLIREMRTSGMGLIYISHRMEEVWELADRVTVFRDGK